MSDQLLPRPLRGPLGDDSPPSAGPPPRLQNSDPLPSSAGTGVPSVLPCGPLGAPLPARPSPGGPPRARPATLLRGAAPGTMGSVALLMRSASAGLRSPGSTSFVPAASPPLPPAPPVAGPSTAEDGMDGACARLVAAAGGAGGSGGGGGAGSTCG